MLYKKLLIRQMRKRKNIKNIIDMVRKSWLTVFYRNVAWVGLPGRRLRHPEGGFL